MEKIERSIIGSILLRPSCYFEVCEVLKPFMFSKANQPLAELIWQRLDNNDTLDLRLLSEQCKKENIGFSYTITNEANTLQVASYAKAVSEKYITAEELRIRGEGVTKLLSGEHYSLVNLQEEQERERLRNLSDNEHKTRVDVIAETLDAIKKAMDNKGAVTGVDTGYSDLNEITGGWQASDLVILAARPSMGKTTQALSYAVNAAKGGIPVLFFSLEMSEPQIFEKINSIFSGVTTEKMRNGKLEQSEYELIQKAFEHHVYDLPIVVEDSCFTISDIVNKIRFFKRKYNIGLVVIDYLGLIDSQNEKASRNHQLEGMTRKLKQVASRKDCNLAILLLSQLNRDLEKRADKRPILADLRDSGAIEQDADMVQFIYRESYYNPETDDKSSEVIIKKNRHGRLTTLKRIFDYPYAEFIEPNRVHSSNEEIPF